MSAFLAARGLSLSAGSRPRAPVAPQPVPSLTAPRGDAWRRTTGRRRTSCAKTTCGWPSAADAESGSPTRRS